MWINDREEIATTYNPNDGSFGWSTAPANADGAVNINNWQHCRELFLHQQAGKRVFYYKHNLPTGRGRSIAEFIGKIEKLLGIKSIRRTKVQATSRRRIIKLTVAPFWDQSEMRRSLFTALLRASMNYRMSANDGAGNFQEALYSVGYTGETRRAVERFIYQRATHYWGDPNLGIGWWSVFRNKSNSEIGRILRKKRKLKHKKPRVVYVQADAA